MNRLLAHISCRSIELLIVIGVFEAARVIDAMISY